MKTIIALNTGSSSIKFNIFGLISHNNFEVIYQGKISEVLRAPRLIIMDRTRRIIDEKRLPEKGHEASLKTLIELILHLGESQKMQLCAVGHRVVHGGSIFTASALVNDEVLEQLAALESLAPLHQPYNIKGITTIQQLGLNIPQVVCFDTAFHHTCHRISKIFALPRELTNEGIIRYGFHGLSYEYIVHVLDNYIGEVASGKVIVAHLGNGASVCAIENKMSVATSLSFTAVDGLMMGTRCGTIDPGVILHLLEQKQWSIEKINELIYQKSGLLGVSGGISSNMLDLELSQAPEALEAIDLFCYRVAREIAGMCVMLEGCDAVIFTAGIGENSATARYRIIKRLGWLGIHLDKELNSKHAAVISSKNSKVLVNIIPTNEEYILAKHTFDMI